MKFFSNSDSKIRGKGEVEIERVAQFDVLVSEKDDLLVSLSLEKARRLEVEDELSAYKRALREFAEQASSVFCLWLGAYLLMRLITIFSQEGKRPKIFRHLWQRLQQE